MSNKQSNINSEAIHLVEKTREALRHYYSKTYRDNHGDRRIMVSRLFQTKTQDHVLQPAYASLVNSITASATPSQDLANEVIHVARSEYAPISATNMFLHKTVDLLDANRFSLFHNTSTRQNQSTLFQSKRSNNTYKKYPSFESSSSKPMKAS